jgi:hypothetical protein
VKRAIRDAWRLDERHYLAIGLLQFLGYMATTTRELAPIFCMPNQESGVKSYALVGRVLQFCRRIGSVSSNAQFCISHDAEFAKFAENSNYACFSILVVYIYCKNAPRARSAQRQRSQPAFIIVMIMKLVTVCTKLHMQNMQKKICSICNVTCKIICRICKIICEAILHMKITRSDMRIFCIFCIRMHYRADFADGPVMGQPEPARARARCSARRARVACRQGPGSGLAPQRASTAAAANTAHGVPVLDPENTTNLKCFLS